MQDKKFERYQSKYQQESEPLTFNRLCRELIERAKAKRPEHLESSAEGSSYEDAVQSAIAQHMQPDADRVLTPEEYARLAAEISKQVERNEGCALRRNGRRQAILALRVNEYPYVEIGPGALRAALSREALSIVRAALPRNANLHRVLDCALPSDGKPVHFAFRETGRIARHLCLEPEEVARHKETIARIARRILSPDNFPSE